MFILRIPSRLLYDLCFPRCELFNYLGVYGLALQHCVLRFHPMGLYSVGITQKSHLGPDMPIWGVTMWLPTPKIHGFTGSNQFFFFF